MAEELGSNAVFLRMPMTSIDQSQRGYCAVQTGSGMSFQCRRAIVSVPTTLYHKITFYPPLPEKKVTLSDNTTTGYYTKMVYVFKEPWWQKAGLAGVLDSEKGPVIFSRDTSIPVDDQWPITCFIVGDKGRNWSKLSRGGVTNRLGSSLARALVNLLMSLSRPTPWRWNGPKKLFSLAPLARSQVQASCQSWDMKLPRLLDTCILWAPKTLARGVAIWKVLSGPASEQVLKW